MQVWNYLHIILTYSTWSHTYLNTVKTLEENDSIIEEEKTNIQESHEAKEKELKEKSVEPEEVTAPPIDPE